jgi:uncharacterized protein YueI
VDKTFFLIKKKKRNDLPFEVVNDASSTSYIPIILGSWKNVEKSGNNSLYLKNLFSASSFFTWKHLGNPTKILIRPISNLKNNI